VSLLLISISGLMSGLTVGLMSIDELDLEMKLASGTPTEQKQARKVLSIINHHHLVLVTLLLSNAAAMEALPILLDTMFSKIISIILSVTFVMIFGEILPQAVFTGPDQLKIACKLIPVVKIITVLLFPISYPIAKLLDRCFGANHGGRRLKNKDIKALVALHENDIIEESGTTSVTGLVSGQIKMIHGAIDLREEVVKNHMIPIEKVFYLYEDTILDEVTINRILKQGYSRIPVYSSENKQRIKNVMHVKTLLCAEHGRTIQESGIKLRAPLSVSQNTTMYELLGKFREGRIHMAIVSDEKEVKGIITMEDVLEQILKTDILDEDDYDKLTSFLAGNLVQNKLSSPQTRTTRQRKRLSALHPRFDEFSMSTISMA